MSELVGVVLCGGMGSRMGGVADHAIKALLPVAGVPMMWYPINSLIRAGVKEVKVICRESQAIEIQHALELPLFKFDSLISKIEVFTNPRESDDWGTADALRHHVHKITKDVVVASCDFVSDCSLIPAVDQFRAHRASFCAVLSEHCVTGPVPGPKMRRSKGRDMIALCEDSERLLFVCSEEDFESAVTATHWLKIFPQICLTARFADCHLYFMKNSVLHLLQKQRKLSSFKADFLPFLLEQQFQEDGTGKEVICMAHVLPRENGTVIAHANTIAAYFEVNKVILKSLTRVSSRLSSGQAFNFHNTGVSAMDSYVSDNAKVSNGVVLKHSVVSGDCELGEKCRVQHSLIMEGAKIAKGVTIANSIVCGKAVIEEGAEVSNCIVTHGIVVYAGEKHSSEVLEGEDADDDWATEA